MILNIRQGLGNTKKFYFWLDIPFGVLYTSMGAQMEASQLYFEDP